jgi:hypothetical protein
MMKRMRKRTVKRKKRKMKRDHLLDSTTVAAPLRFVAGPAPRSRWAPASPPST